MNLDPKILDHERRLAQLESARATLDAALNKLKENPPPGQQPVPVPLPAIVVEETKLGNMGNEILVTKAAPAQPLPNGRIKLWVVYQSELQEIEVDGNLA